MRERGVWSGRHNHATDATPHDLGSFLHPTRPGFVSPPHPPAHDLGSFLHHISSDDLGSFAALLRKPGPPAHDLGSFRDPRIRSLRCRGCSGARRLLEAPRRARSRGASSFFEREDPMLRPAIAVMATLALFFVACDDASNDGRNGSTSCNSSSSSASSSSTSSGASGSSGTSSSSGASSSGATSTSSGSGTTSSSGASTSSSSSGAVSSSSGGAGQCAPGAHCGGTAYCEDRCYGDRCCTLSCRCDTNANDPAAQLSCQLFCK